MIDFEKIKATYFMDEMALTKLLKICNESIQMDSKLLEVKLQEQHFDQVHNVAHKMKAGFRYLQQDDTVTILELMQQSAKSKDQETLSQLFERLKPMLAVTIENLENHVLSVKYKL